MTCDVCQIIKAAALTSGRFYLSKRYWIENCFIIKMNLLHEKHKQDLYTFTGFASIAKLKSYLAYITPGIGKGSRNFRIKN